MALPVFKTFTGQTIVVEPKNDLLITGVLNSGDGSLQLVSLGEALGEKYAIVQSTNAYARTLKEANRISKGDESDGGAGNICNV